MGYKLSVIVPMYNSAQYVERCLRSLMEQTLDDIQFIFIDDASTDGTLNVVDNALSAYPDRRQHVTIVRHDTNLGIGASRQQGHDLATGEYVTHCDSDDWVDSGYYSAMYDQAKSMDADLVVGNHQIEHTDRSVKVDVHHFACPDDFINFGGHLFLSLWSHLIRRSFLSANDLRFFDGVNYSEDFGLLFRCYCLSRRNAAYNGEAVYHYNKTNAGALTARKATVATINSQTSCMRQLEGFLRERGIDASRNGLLLDEKFHIKEAFLLLSPSDYKGWRSTYDNVADLLRRQPRMSAPCKAAWWLGQHIHPWILKSYISLASR